MLQKLILISFVLIGSFVALSCGRSENSETVSVEKTQQIDLKPFRVLVIIGDQWSDPQSYAIDGRRVKSGDFLDVINMLKAWGIPFDILRLDQQRLQINRFLDGAAKPNYGCMIWMADPAILTGSSANYETLKRAVNEYGISMIGLFDYIETDQVAGLLGINLQNSKNIQPDRFRDK